MPRTGGEGKPGGEASRDGLDREDLVAGRPQQAAEDVAVSCVDDVDATDAARGVEAGRVVAEARQDARRADECEVAVKPEAPSPAGKPGDGAESAFHADSHFAVAAVV